MLSWFAQRCILRVGEETAFECSRIGKVLLVIWLRNFRMLQLCFTSCLLQHLIINRTLLVHLA